MYFAQYKCDTHETKTNNHLSVTLIDTISLSVHSDTQYLTAVYLEADEQICLIADT